MRVAAVLLLPFLFAAAIVAQDDVLAVESQGDLAGHQQAAALLKQTRVQLHAESMTAKELCKVLSLACGDRLIFVCRARDSAAAPRLTLDVRAASLWSVLSIAEGELGLRFVFRSGVVFLTPADDVRPLTFLEIYDLRAECTPLTSFPGPELRLGGADDDRPLFPEPYDSGTTVSGFTADGVETLLRETVRPDSWADERVSMSNQHGLFLIRQTPAAHREIRALLTKVGLRAPVRTVAIAPKKPVPQRRQQAGSAERAEAKGKR